MPERLRIRALSEAIAAVRKAWDYVLMATGSDLGLKPGAYEERVFPNSGCACGLRLKVPHGVFGPNREYGHAFITQ
jgi:hypothetical protein